MSANFRGRSGEFQVFSRIRGMPPRFALAVALLLLTPPALAQVSLPPAVERELVPLKIPSSATAAVVQEVGVDRPLLAVNPATAMNPASVIDRKSTRLNSSHMSESRMPSSA